MTTSIEQYIVEEIMLGDSNTKLDPDQSLLTSGILDSLALLRLVEFIEENLGVEIDADELVGENFETVNMINSLIASKQKQ